MHVLTAVGVESDKRLCLLIPSFVQLDNVLLVEPTCRGLGPTFPLPPSRVLSPCLISNVCEYSCSASGHGLYFLSQIAWGCQIFPTLT